MVAKPPVPLLKKKMVVVERGAQPAACTAFHGAVWAGRGQSVDDLVGNPQGYPRGHPHGPKGCPPLSTRSRPLRVIFWAFWGGGMGEGAT
jgi:hypothetical protein